MKISTILDQIDLGSMALPEFQRGYVWNRDQVRGLMQSLYRRYPVGSLLVWVTRSETAPVRGEENPRPGLVELILDGQQRMTTLYGIIRGRPPRFFDGNPSTFTGLYFHLDDEVFEFYSPAKMADNPLWINVTELMQKGIGGFIARIHENPDLSPRLPMYLDRLNRLAGIQDIDLHIERVTGEDKSLDVVVDIFNKVNSGGTKLSQGDLALAEICARWPEAREEMKKRLLKWRRASFNFKLEWLLRVVNAIVTGEAMFQALRSVDTAAIRAGLHQAEKSVDYLLNLISSRLGLDHDRVLGSRYSFPLLARYLTQKEGQLDHRERDRLLYWYVHTFLWGRYAGSTETVLNRDLGLIEERDGALDRLIDELRRVRGDLRLQPEDFLGWSQGARFYPLMYMMTRVWHARDWYSGIELSNHLLGRMTSLELHHIFPKSLLYEHGYKRRDVNAIANFTFLTKETNLRVSNRNPAEYLQEIAERDPSLLESHWIPTDPRLWRVENYLEFLAERRRLLADAANRFLDSLLHGNIPESRPPEADGTVSAVDVGIPAAMLGGVAGEEEERMLIDLNVWVVEQGLPEGEFLYELVGAGSSEPLAILDLAWPEGLQPGFSEPVAVLLDEDHHVHEVANRAGFRYFTDVASFKDYVLREIIASEAASD